MKWLSSFGLKRYLAAVVSAMAAVVSGVPGLGTVVTLLQSIAGGLGAAGELHSFAAGTYSLSAKDLASIVAVLIVVAKFVPQLHAFVTILETIAVILGGAAIGAGLPKIT